MAQRQRETRDSETQLDDREEQQAQSAAAGATMREALQQHQDGQFLERFRDVDIKGADEEQVLAELGLELAGVYAVANEDESDYRRHKWLNRNKAERYKSARNPGRLCRGPIRSLAVGVADRAGEGPSPPLSQRERQKIAEAMDAKTALHSLGKGAEGLSAVSEVTAVTEHRRETEPEDNSGGLISKIFG
jgi:hypothetical protein